MFHWDGRCSSGCVGMAFGKQAVGNAALTAASTHFSGRGNHPGAGDGESGGGGGGDGGGASKAENIFFADKQTFKITLWVNHRLTATAV